MSDQEPDKDEAALQARLAKLNDALRARDERAAAQTPTERRRREIPSEGR